MNTIREHFEQAHRLLEQVMNDDAFLNSVRRAGEAMAASIDAGGKIISCGNGGSMCDAMHFAEELTGRYRDNRAPIAAISISDPSHLSCVGNDYGFPYVFSRFVENGLFVVALTGKDGGELAKCCDVEVRVPWMAYADRIQEIHIKVIHALIDFIEQHRAHVA